jgi:Cupin domain
MLVPPTTIPASTVNASVVFSAEAEALSTRDASMTPASPAAPPLSANARIRTASTRIPASRAASAFPPAAYGGKEYGYVTEGRLGVRVGFDTYELAPGMAISFDASMPHRLWAIGAQPARALWIVVGRQSDARGSIF